MRKGKAEGEDQRGKPQFSQKQLGKRQEKKRKYLIWSDRNCKKQDRETTQLRNPEWSSLTNNWGTGQSRGGKGGPKERKASNPKA